MPLLFPKMEEGAAPNPREQLINFEQKGLEFSINEIRVKN
jgi:hypothetical protein